MARAAASLAVLAAGVLAGCARRDAGPIRIGAVVGADAVVGVRMALADVRSSGGVDGRVVEMVEIPHVLATAAEPSIRAADSLASDPRVLAVVGHSNSAASLAASQVYNARGLVHIAPTSTAPLFSDAGPWSFRLVPDDQQQAMFLVRQVAGRQPRRVALVYVNDDYGRGLAVSVRDLLAAAGVAPVYESPYLEGADEAQLAASADAAVATRPDLLVWLGRAPELSTFLRHLRPRAGALPVYASDGVDVSFTYQAPRRLEGVRFVRFVDPATPDSGFQRFRARYRGEQRRDVTTDAVTGYDAAMLVVAALRSGARTRLEVREYLEQVGRGRPAFRGLSGTIAFDERGDVVRPHLLAEVRADGVHPLPAR